MSSQAPRAVVAGHAGFAAAMVEVVARIAGKADALLAVSNDGLDARGVEDAITGALKRHGANVVFTDLPAGSVAIAARRAAHTDPSIAIVTGTTAAMLLDFVLGEATDAPALERCAARGRESIVVHAAKEGMRAD